MFDWMHDYDVRSLGIDARRFTSFGVIKASPGIFVVSHTTDVSRQGFLRRVHRWPVLIDDIPSISPHITAATPPLTTRRRSMSIPTPNISITTSTPSAGPLTQTPTRLPLRPIRRPSDATAPLASVSATSASASPVETRMPPLPTTPSAAELSLGRQLGQRRSTPTTPPRKGRESTGRRNTLTSGDPVRPRPSRSPSNPAPAPQPLYPPALPALLDGEHHTDELCTMFSVGWPTLERWLAIIGGGKGEGDLGKVLIIYR